MKDLETSIEGLPKHEYDHLEILSPGFRIFLSLFFVFVAGVVYVVSS